ncbi:TPA: SDR family NAD(P)-dependent oxidoreductase [Legionella pneumophila]|uniref:SDR family NAD(P)-dependent oxidoreductase n=1 Tax=Legionella pneumophila TaxID=446 RepID=A0AAN5T1B2_LEGPN|nr:SDR family NAD(P)-dependent oxidoreductase [Legionella pneumophila]AEW51118.1 oxidoreductase dehydrogenase, short chain [Legionella pneumophila subsp. pneumophila ATCC 43290]AGN13731.1 oxidoreductase dehydrogenase, short chain [Legionella pneumophila subsp. pneumophila str. Thunder Bay]MCK1860944.1 SDR family NAD(P)-dependent oxidoreductase [Legionella pneumophila]MDW9029221.1 SDR family NAD(P)-dependent oxidoreductase [Legionella pneumophila]MDW9152259.1 SDR family NAD(P)-dependent oxidore
MNAVVITGAASGIGLALSKVCLQKGKTVVMVDNNEGSLNRADKLFSNDFPNQIISAHCDVTQEHEISELAQLVYQNLGQIDWIFNNAGIIGNLLPAWELQASDINQVMEVNLHGMLNMIRSFMPYLFKQNFRSHIINMASLYALCTGSQMAAYSMSKHAVLALSESLYFDLNRLKKPVDVSVVFPSFTDTSLLATSGKLNHSPIHNQLNNLLAHSRPAIEVAEHIVREVEQKRFYILPDKEVKGYCEDRTKAILLQENPHRNSVEQLMCSLLKRQSSEANL